MATELYYEVHGEGPSVVFAHGLGGNHASWFQQVPFFARSYQVVTFDHRGFGNSRDVAGGADRPRFVEDLKDLLDHLDITKAALVGQSMGGATCAGGRCASDACLGVQSLMSIIAMIPMRVVSRVLRGDTMAGWD